MKRLIIAFGIVVGLVAFAAREYEYVTAPNYGWEPDTTLPDEVRQWFGAEDESLRHQAPELFQNETRE